MDFSPPPAPNYGKRQAMPEAEWGDILTEIRERWPKWDMSATDRKDWWAMLSTHTGHAVRMALRDVRARYASNEPKLAWVLKSMQQQPREKTEDDGTEAVQVMDPPCRATMIHDLESWDMARVISRARGHWLQRADIRQSPDNSSDRPDDWTDQLLCLVWASMRITRGMEVPGHEERRPKDKPLHGDEMSMRDFCEAHPGSPLGHMLAAPKTAEID